MSNTGAPPVIIDDGSDTCKAGFAGEDIPHVVIPTVVGVVSRKMQELSPPGYKTHYAGDTALAKRGFLKLRHPIHQGVFSNYPTGADTMPFLWHQVFDKLSIPSEERPLLLTEAPYNPNARRDREKTAEIMFEQFGVPSLYIANRAVLALYAAGKKTGVVVDSGAGVTNVVVVVDEGRVVDCEGVTRRLEVAGDELTDFLVRELMERGILLTTRQERMVAKAMKEKLCYVALDYEGEVGEEGIEASYELPDGEAITIGKERIRIPEALFRPSLVGLPVEGVHEMVYNAIQSCHIEQRSHLNNNNNIVLSSGSMSFPGMAERMRAELESLSLSAHSSGNFDVSIAPHGRFAAWVGGSIFASTNTFREMGCSKGRFEEVGVRGIY